MLYYPMKPYEILWDPMKSYEIPWNPMKCAFWNSQLGLVGLVAPAAMVAQSAVWRPAFTPGSG